MVTVMLLHKKIPLILSRYIVKYLGWGGQELRYMKLTLK